MKKSILWLGVLSSCFLQLLATEGWSSEESLESSEETLEELDEENDNSDYPWSSEEDTDDSNEAEDSGGVLNLDDLSSSEESSQENYETLKGIGAMLKDFWFSKYNDKNNLKNSMDSENLKNKEKNTGEVKNSLEDEDKNVSHQENSKQEMEVSKKKDEKENKIVHDEKPKLKYEDASASQNEQNFKKIINSEGSVITKTDNRDEKTKPELSEADLPESQQEPHHVIWTYVLWRPRVFEDDNQLLTHYHPLGFLKKMFQPQQEEWEGGEDGGRQDDNRQGWQDDREQLDLPRVAALQDKDEPDMYDNFVDSFNSMNEKIQQVASTPEFKQNIFYFLMGIVGFMMLVLFNDSFSKKNEPRTIQDHYFLTDTGSSAKLPSYEECIKTDKNILVNMDESEVFNKVDLSLPVLVVDMEDKDIKPAE